MKWKADNPKQKIISIGRAMLALGLGNTHSGNISVRRGGEMFITKTGSMKGHLQERDICQFGLDNTDYGLFQASAETGEHRRVLKYAGAVIHAHALPVILYSFLECEIRPVDAFGRRHLPLVPVREFASPIGSKEMEEVIPEILRETPAMVVKAHGPFVRGRDLDEAFFLTCLMVYGVEILLALKRCAIDRSRLPELTFPAIDAHGFDGLTGERDVYHPVLLEQIRCTAHGLFYMKLSPFATGSLSVVDGRDMLYSPRLSLPDDFQPGIRRVSLSRDEDEYFTRLHQAVYRHSNAKAALFTLSPEAMAEGLRVLIAGQERIIPVDAEGGFLYPAVPVVLPDTPPDLIVEQAARHKMVVIAGLGVLAIGLTPGHVIHHNSSIAHICHLRQELQNG